MADDNKWLWAAGGYALGNANSKHTTEHTIEIRDHHHYHEVKPDEPADIKWRKDIEECFAYASDAASLAEAEMLLHPKVQAIRYYIEIRNEIEHDYKLMGVHKADLIALIDKYTEIILESAKLEKKTNNNKRNKIAEKCKNEIEVLFNTGLDDIANWESIFNRYDEMDNLLPYNFFLTGAKRLELSSLIGQYRKKITKIKEEKLKEKHALVLIAEQAKKKERILGMWFVAFCLIGFFYCMKYSSNAWPSYVRKAAFIGFLPIIFPALVYHCCSKSETAVGTKAVIGAIGYVAICILSFKLSSVLPDAWHWSSKIDISLGIPILAFPCVMFLFWSKDKHSIGLKKIFRSACFISFYLFCFNLYFILPPGWHWYGRPGLYLEVIPKPSLGG